ncbi:hypothetical protein PTTG_10047 [Puccinia triticina 1-1 BBBD Race 1]|uniref:Uncharacterized protein n=1 Tax=Puccinia triticina (isolate 1-1 / race 1 (BBBD)) TaxID=630390 RepID=A0A0C4FA07_PUCT1|nr:hypothetical protein PTTG_10047 [Puccinia triticina 1-1 BBBD Race 1]
MVNAEEPKLHATCGSLDPWQPPAILSQSFSGTHQSDPARKKHEPPKPFKAPVLPPLVVRKPAQRTTTPKNGSDTEDMGLELELFDCIPVTPCKPGLEEELTKESPAESVAPKSTSPSPKVHFERGIAKDHPNAVNGMLKKMLNL